MHYYNENNHEAAAWLRVLMREGWIPEGWIDTRSILDVKAEELEPFRQCHFFAGIGGWALALAMAGVDPSASIDTASCPCQPFSAVGKRKGYDDERHLWPHFRAIQQKRRSPIIIGEQVASEDGRHWLAGVQFDLEQMGYSFGGADLCAAGIGAPHVRQRLYWLATLGLGHSNGAGRQERECGLKGEPIQEVREDEKRFAGLSGVSGVDGGAWAGASFIPCADGKARRIKSGLEPLAYGIPGRVGLLRGYGNAIVPPLAAAFIESAMGAIEDVFGGGWR